MPASEQGDDWNLASVILCTDTVVGQEEKKVSRQSEFGGGEPRGRR